MGLATKRKYTLNGSGKDLTANRFGCVMNEKPVLLTNAETGEQLPFKSAKAAADHMGILPSQINYYCKLNKGKESEEYKVYRGMIITENRPTAF